MTIQGKRVNIFSSYDGYCQMDTMKLQGFFNQHPVFTHEEFVKFLANKGEENPNTSKALLAYHLRAGRIYRIRRGLYASIPLGTSPNEFSVDQYQIAAKLTDDAVIGYYSALALYGRAYSVRSVLTFLSNHEFRKLIFQSYEYQRIFFPKTLRKHKQENFEVKLIQGYGVRATSFERTLVDMLDRPDLCGGWEEIWRSLELVEYFNIDKVIEYALLLNNSTTIAKVGFYLEQHQKILNVENHQLKQLQAYRPKHPHYMERERKLPSQYSTKWNLMVPKQIIEKSWEEPL